MGKGEGRERRVYDGKGRTERKCKDWERGVSMKELKDCQNGERKKRDRIGGTV